LSKAKITFEPKAKREMDESARMLVPVVNLPRSTGQIYGLLFLTAYPLSLDRICGMLGMSKGSASTGTRQLCSGGAIRQVWVPGEPRAHFEASGDLAQVLRGSYDEFIKPRLVSSERRLRMLFEELERDLEKNILSREEIRFARNGCGASRAFRRRRKTSARWRKN
jgi:DNA-binding transcriptional regulator GbsR (MarR family)